MERARHLKYQAMSKNVNISNDQFEEQWIFSWRRVVSRKLGLFFAALIVVPLAIFILKVINVRIFIPPAVSNRDGNILLLVDSSQNQNLLIRLAEKTPFPISINHEKLEPFTSAITESMDRMNYDYIPVLKAVELKEEPKYFRRLSVMPELVKSEFKPASSGGQLQPTLKFFSKLATKNDMPTYWPEFSESINSNLEGLKIMLQVSKEGKVTQVFPLGNKSSINVNSVETWAKKITFPNPSKVSGWQAAEITFVRVDD
jgi:hypothetical protein